LAKKTEDSVDTSRACSNRGDRKDKHSHSEPTTAVSRHMLWMWIEGGIVTVVKILNISLGIVGIER